MIGNKDSAVSTVVGYLQEPRQIYYPRSGRFGSFVRWDKARTHSISKRRVVETAKTRSSEQSQDVLIILNGALSATLIKQYDLSFLAKFTGSVVGSEGFHLYLMSSP
jgi:hypothetical protein